MGSGLYVHDPVLYQTDEWIDSMLTDTLLTRAFAWAKFYFVMKS